MFLICIWSRKSIDFTFIVSVLVNEAFLLTKNMNYVHQIFTNNILSFPLNVSININSVSFKKQNKKKSPNNNMQILISLCCGYQWMFKCLRYFLCWAVIIRSELLNSCNGRQVAKVLSQLLKQQECKNRVRSNAYKCWDETFEESKWTQFGNMSNDIPLTFVFTRFGVHRTSLQHVQRLSHCRCDCASGQWRYEM